MQRTENCIVLQGVQIHRQAPHNPVLGREQIEKLGQEYNGGRNFCTASATNSRTYAPIEIKNVEIVRSLKNYFFLRTRTALITGSLGPAALLQAKLRCAMRATSQRQPLGQTACAPTCGSLSLRS